MGCSCMALWYGLGTLVRNLHAQDIHCACSGYPLFLDSISVGHGIVTRSGYCINVFCSGQRPLGNCPLLIQVGLGETFY